ncbi:MAG: DNA-3-methyladenine glycosylase [Candidatus Lokiarchaeota archaeon]|nr:DNA-3-methyladenine glycosylase [Candidatus Lokiarchaeota archaeon]
MRLNRDFFNRETEMVAKELLGKYLVRETENDSLIGKIIEVEAYLGPIDKACHTYNYKKTKRTKTMYEKPGTIYIYLIYGMYHCLNVITEPESMPCAVLIRELYPIEGIEIIKKNRNVKIGKNYKNLLDGPGKLCIGLNIKKDYFNGKDSCESISKLFFTEGEVIDERKISSHKRIGIDYAEEYKDRLLRFKLNFQS